MAALVFDEVRVLKDAPRSLKQSIEKVMTSDHYVSVVHMSPNVVQPFHDHEGDWSVTIVSGMMMLTADGVPHELHPGDTLLLPAMTVHSVHAGPVGCTFLEVVAEHEEGFVKQEIDTWKQFFINDNDESFSTAVSFHDQVVNRTWNTAKVVFDEVKVIEGESILLEQAILKALPIDHWVAVMNDTPNVIHYEHVHQVDEMLFIVHGKLTISSGGQTFELTSGERLVLPANTVHESKAGEEGCIYLILKLDKEEHYTVRL